ncbi:MAG: ATP-binding protein, partial [Anaeroplasmataceae bacterium]
MIKLTTLRFINWHYLGNETIHVKDNVILTGQNASGKSTVLDALTFILTAGETNFNLAANDKSKRDLKGYVKCKLGTENKEYLRDGDVTGHIALEFYDESKDSYFICGAVIDAFGELAPPKVLFYTGNEQISDNLFLDGNTILSTTEFRKKNSTYEYFLTKKEAKRGFRTAFGSINEDYFKLIPKALAFKPINDVKDFIYSNILEAKEIDVSSIKSSIRAYKDLEETLNQIKMQISDLKEIEEIFNDVKIFDEKKQYYQYLMQYFEKEKINNEIKKIYTMISSLEEMKVLKASDLKKITEEVDSLNERSRELYNLLSDNKDFKAEEYLDKQISKLKTIIDELSNSQNNYVNLISEFKDEVSNLKKVSKNKIYNELSNIPLSTVSSFDAESIKLNLLDFDNRLKYVYNENHQILGSLNNKKNSIVSEISHIKDALKSLDGKKLRYDSNLVQLKNELTLSLKEIYNYDVSVHVFCELIEINDKSWSDTIEIFLGNRRFNLIVEPKYYDTALEIYARIKNKYRLYGIGLVNTKKIETYNKFDDNSLASIMSSENLDAQRYVNMTCGKVIMCNNEKELEHYNMAVTKDGLVYRSYVASSLNPNIEKPFIGKDAIGEQTEKWNTLGQEKHKEYIEIAQHIQLVERELELIDLLDFKAIINEIDNTIKYNRSDVQLQELLKQKRNSKNITSDELSLEYDNIIQTIKNYDIEKANILQEIGSINSKISSCHENIEQNKIILIANKSKLEELSQGNILIENQAKEELEKLTNFNNSKVVEEFNEKLIQEEQNYNDRLDTLRNQQYKYTSKYNSMFSTGLSEIDKFLNELNKLEKSELIKYENKVRSARENAEIIFKEDFLSKLKNHITTAEMEIEKINETLREIKFGNDQYEFIFPKSKEFAGFYDMVKNNILTDGNSLFSNTDFQIKYDQQLNELFDSLNVDETNSNGVINKFTDYRTYMDYDIKISNQVGDIMLYSKVFKEKSGGETQVPFYVAMLASFVRIFTHGKLSQK